MKLSPLRSSWKNSFFIATISAHAFQPADSLRLTMCLRERFIDCSLRIFSSYMANQPRQPLDSSRFIM